MSIKFAKYLCNLGQPWSTWHPYIQQSSCQHDLQVHIAPGKSHAIMALKTYIAFQKVYYHHGHQGPHSFKFYTIMTSLVHMVFIKKDSNKEILIMTLKAYITFKLSHYYNPSRVIMVLKYYSAFELLYYHSPLGYMIFRCIPS